MKKRNLMEVIMGWGFCGGCLIFLVILGLIIWGISAVLPALGNWIYGLVELIKS